MKSAITEVISERLKNAFLANFILSWLIINHSIILYCIFSDDKPNKKLQYINNLNFNFLTDFLYPLVLVAAYIFLLPLVNLVLMKIKFKFVEPLLSNHSSQVKMSKYDSEIQLEDKRLDVVFREKEREIRFEESRTKEQSARTQAAEKEANYLREKQEIEQRLYQAEKLRREELEKTLKLEDVIEKEEALAKREALLEKERRRLEQESFENRLRESNYSWVEKNGPIRSGDRLVIDFVGKINDEEFEGGRAEDFPLELGHGRMIPGFEDGLMGNKVGDRVNVDVVFPSEYHAENLKGKSAVFEVLIKKVEAPVIYLNKDYLDNMRVTPAKQ